MADEHWRVEVNDWTAPDALDKAKASRDAQLDARREDIPTRTTDPAFTALIAAVTALAIPDGYTVNVSVDVSREESGTSQTSIWIHAVAPPEIER
jgi:hypothetical protein